MAPNLRHGTVIPLEIGAVTEQGVVACSPELGTTEGYPFKIDLNLLSSCCVGMLCFMCVLKCMYSYKNNFLRNKK